MSTKKRKKPKAAPLSKSPRGKPKISEMILNYAGELLDLAEDFEHKQSLVNVACSAWNIATLPSEKREEAIAKYMDSYRRYNSQMGEEACIAAEENLRKLIAEKHLRYPHEQRQVVDAKLERRDDQDILWVTSCSAG